MKLVKVSLYLSFLLVSFLLVFVSAIRLSRQRQGVFTESVVFAKDLKTEPNENTQLTKNTEASLSADFKKTNVEVNYYLPYPGILPDHPLYWLKMVRDRLALWLTRGEVEKFDRLRLYADKRLGAAQALILGNKLELGITTASKAEKYLNQAVVKLNELDRDENASSDMKEVLKKAILKHIEVLDSLKNFLPDQAKDVLEKSLEQTRSNQEVVNNLID